MNKELAVIEQQTGTDTYRMSTDAARMCKDIVLASAQDIKGKKYVKVEGWQSIAIAHGCTASSGDVERTETGFRAIGKVIRMADGMIISQAEGFVGDDEPTWASRAEYAKRAMAQTRAISRACRSAFAHVVVMMNAGLSTTPAEEIPAEGFDERAHTPPPQQHKPASARDDSHQVITGIEQVTMKTGDKNGKPWTLYTIHAGDKYTTFDKKHAEAAKAAAESGIPMVLTFKDSGKGLNLIAITQDEPMPVGEEKVPF